VTDQLIAPVIPSAARPAADTPGRRSGNRSLPLASPPRMLADAVYGMSRVDASGRVTGQVIIHVLKCSPVTG
jgi:hypothetical protein